MVQTALAVTDDVSRSHVTKLGQFLKEAEAKEQSLVTV
jgi:hypothetical protein